jgi:signal transduction histidine kinase/ActR/RegA family two-component response regulator
MSRLRWFVLLVVLTGAYILAGRVGLQFFGLLNPSASAVWPPTGVAIAALLVLGMRAAPAVFVGAFVVNLLTAGTFLSSLGIAAGNTLEGVAAAYLVGRFANGAACFERARDIFKFAMLAAIASTAISATIGLGVLAAAGLLVGPATAGEVWLTWWLGDAAGAILIAPLLVLWYRDPSLRGAAPRAFEAVLLAITVAAGTALVFFQPLLAHYPLAFMSLPPLVWAAFRFRQRAVAATVALMSVIATWATVSGHGAFALATPNESLLVLQAFTAMIALTTLVMCALVQERIALLVRERAALANAEAALRSSDVFLAMLSHELRNPLSAISAAAAVLDHPATTPEAANRAARIIKRQTSHFARLIDDLLDVARVTVGKMALQRTTVNLADAVSAAMQSSTTNTHRSLPRVQLDLATAWVNADPARVTQIVTNLLHNALKYTGPEGTIRVATHEDDGYGVLTVADTGAGIAPELLPRVFDLFTQGEQGPDRAHGGLGVGLALVKRITEMHSGTVEASSDGPGKGSTFVVRLPRADAAAAAELQRASPGSTPRAYRILIVEDNADARESLRIILETAGHEILEAADGETGVEYALKLEPSVALIDIGLPGIDGCEVARRIRAIKSGIRLIALTGYGRDEDRRRSRQAGFDAHLVKPVVVQNLLETMDSLLSSARPRTRARS